MRRHEIAGIGGHARVSPAAFGDGIVVELFGPRGGFQAGCGFEVIAAPAFVRAFRRARTDAEAIYSELREADEWAATVLERDTELGCRRCEATQRVAFAACLEDGFPTCCGLTMHVRSTDAQVDEAVRLHVSTQLFEHDLKSAELV